jgi:hypothetical protein
VLVERLMRDHFGGIWGFFGRGGNEGISDFLRGFWGFWVWESRFWPLLGAQKPSLGAEKPLNGRVLTSFGAEKPLWGAFGRIWGLGS